VQEAFPHCGLSQPIWKEYATSPGCCCPSARDSYIRELPRHRAPQATKPAQPENRTASQQPPNGSCHTCAPEVPATALGSALRRQMSKRGVNLSGFAKRVHNDSAISKTTAHTPANRILGTLVIRSCYSQLQGSVQGQIRCRSCASKQYVQFAPSACAFATTCWPT